MSFHDSTKRERNRDRITAEAQKRINFILLRSLFIRAPEFQIQIFYFREVRIFEKERTFEIVCRQNKLQNIRLCFLGRISESSFKILWLHRVHTYS